MATPMTPSKLLEVLKDAGLVVREYDGWRARCRCCVGAHNPAGPFVRAWGDVNGTVTHITAGNLGGRTVQQYIASAILGDPAIPCKVQMVVDPGGVVWVISAGRCNHAGKVGGTVKAHLRAADFSTTDDFDNRFTGGSADGNAFTYGIENIAAVSMSATQRATSVKINAAIALHHGWTGQESVGHGEISNQRGKADPNLDMGKFRRDVMAAVKKGTKPTTVPPVDPSAAAGPSVLSSSLNGGSYNAHGAATYKARVDRYVKRRLAHLVDVIDLQEIGNGINRKTKPNCLMRGRLDSGFGNAYHRHTGSDGRYTYSNPAGVKGIQSGVITAAKSSWYLGDDKQAAYLVYEKDGVRAMDVSYHLENEDGTVADAKRVAQLLSIVHQALAIAAKLGVDIRNILFVGDSNSEGMVAAAMAAIEWRNAAAGTRFENSPTFTGWDGHDSKRFDYGFVHKTAAKAAVVTLTPDPDVSDHAELVIERTLTRVA